MTVTPSGGGDPAVAAVTVRAGVGTFGIDIVLEQPAPTGYEETLVTIADWWSSVLEPLTVSATPARSLRMRSATISDWSASGRRT